MSDPILSIRDLTVKARLATETRTLIDRVSLDLGRGEILGLVGESGSGKSMICRALVQLLPSKAITITGGSVMLGGRDLTALDENAMRTVRGSEIGMIFQNPTSHLDPVMRIGDQIAEGIRYHQGKNRREARLAAVEILDQVGFPDPQRQYDNYAHEFSGGMRQRAMIAAALSCNPEILIADEPTTALDVTIQAQILRLLMDLRDRRSLSIILITHDLGIVAQTCDRIAVLRAGRLLETGPKRQVLSAPKDPYTVSLLKSHPSMSEKVGPSQTDLSLSEPLAASSPQRGEGGPQDRMRGSRSANAVPEHPLIDSHALGTSPHRGEEGPAPAGTASIKPLLEIDDLFVRFPAPGLGLFNRHKQIAAVDGVSLRIMPGETVGIVGESGSGKSTLARAILGLTPLTSGHISFDGFDLARQRSETLAHIRSQASMVFQDPYGALNARLTIGDMLAEVLHVHGRTPKDNIPRRIGELLDLVGLEREFANRRPRSMSGGQCQRAGIARALAIDPRLVIADECVAALDVTIQAQIIDLFRDLKTRMNLTLLFIAHDLAIVRNLCERVVVMYRGKIVEEGRSDAVFANPQHAYTAALISAIPDINPDKPLLADAPAIQLMPA